MIKLILLSSLFFCNYNLAQTTKLKQPNIVFILVDDLGYGECGFNGGKEIYTPQIDQLAKSGAILANNYVQPVCSPTRACLLTGRYPTHTGVYNIITPGASWGLPLNETTLADALKANGYQTAITGKLDDPSETKNLALKYPERVILMQKRLNEMLKDAAPYNARANEVE